MKRETYLDFVAQLLPADEFLLFKENYKKHLPKTVKYITSRTSKDQFEDMFGEIKEPKFSNGPHIYDDLHYIPEEKIKGLGSNFLHQAGYFYIQELSAGFSAQVLPIESGDMVLDLCAAPGGKSVQLVDKLMNEKSGFLVSNEPLDGRRKALIYNLNRCGCYPIAVTGYDGTVIGGLAPEFFDKVLVDAPCSGEGMQYKSDKSVAYWNQKQSEKLARLQKELLISGLQALKVGGELVYSTCTLNPLENECVVKTVIENYPQIELVNVEIDQKSEGLARYLESPNLVARFWPHIQKTGGFFIAKFKKNSSLPKTSSKQDKRTLATSTLDWSDDLQERVRESLNRWFGIRKRDRIVFCATQQAVYLTREDAKKLPKTLFIEKFGVPIFKKDYQGDLIPQQGIVACFGSKIENNTIELSKENQQELCTTQSLKGLFGKEGDFLITTLNGKGMFLVKQVNGAIKLKC